MRIYLFLFLLLATAMSVFGQDVAQPGLHQLTWDVFARRNAENPAQTDLIFINLLSGERTTIGAEGEQFTLTNGGVIFLDSQAGQVKLAKADGIIRDHPFIHASSDARRVDWVVSRDGEHIVWTISQMVSDGQLVTATWLADIAGAEIRELLVYGPRAGIHLLPIAFSENKSEIYMEAHVDGSEGLSPYAQRTGLFALVVTADELHTRALPGDPNCLCAVGFGANRMLRLAPNLDAGGLDVEVFPLDGGEGQIIPALSRGDYRDGGNILLNADGTQAIYALSQVRDSAAETDLIRTLLVHVDISNGQQRIASNPIPDFARPLAFTDDDRALLFTARRSNLTYKLDLEKGRQSEVADAVYLGQLGGH